jgi:hypothetical protein
MQTVNAPLVPQIYGDKESTPDKSGGLNKSTQHHLIKGCSLKVVLYEARETVWIF